MRHRMRWGAGTGLATAGILILTRVLGATLEVHGQTSSKVATSDSADVAAVVTQYHAALVAGDSATALRLLTPDVLILESGSVQTRDEYRAGHLAADMNFARSVPGIRANMRVVVRGDAAWATSTSASRGEYRGRTINTAGAELMVLSREADGWKIRAIHWSSRNLTPRTP